LSHAAGARALLLTGALPRALLLTGALPRALLLAGALSLALAPARAALAAGKADAPWAKSEGDRVGLELDLLARSNADDVDGIDAEVSSFGLTFTVVGQLRLLEKLHLDAELPLAFGSVSTSLSATANGNPGYDESRSSFLFGNPTLGAHTTRRLSDDLVVFAGGTVSIPLLGGAPDGDAAGALQATQPARASFDVHRFADQRLPFRLRGGAEIRVLPELLYRGDLGALLTIPIGSVPADFYLEQGNELEYRRDSGLGGGLRIQEVFTLTDVGDKVQTALMPFFAYAHEPGTPGYYGRLGLLVALDERAGFGFDQGKVATLRLEVGGNI
jgi:hypothetical protein